MPQYAQNPYVQAPSGPVPLSQPLYGASFGAAIKRFFQKYATFSGRASRSEYWWYTLFQFIVITVLYIGLMIALTASIDPVTGDLKSTSFMIPMVLLVIFGLATLVPGLALTVRRLHDGGFSGWLVLVALVPGLGALAIAVLALMPSKPEGARFDAGAQQQYAPYPPASPQA
ncbi:DUF805 domain-containing protein [Arthrobacter sp. Sa2CUA1]|uniref:DUF805 domain-containing protein n=1 Tax=Arthrobacter gallicola TaxID=2762225 RepID=A0ABR8UXC9_9MICC|nr:DUF805 domain-containing protein [Arthrobacter gallicola]